MKNYEIFAVVGIALVFFVSLLYGFSQMLAEAVSHIIKDFTIELAVHAYIAGTVLILYAVFLYAFYLYRTRRKRK